MKDNSDIAHQQELEKLRSRVKELALSEQRFRAALNCIGDGMIVTDAKGFIAQMNPVAESLTGWSEKDAIGRLAEEVFCIINEETRIVVKSPVSPVLKKGTAVGLANNSLLISRDGIERPVSGNGTLIHDESGRVSGVVLVFRDQSKHRVELDQKFHEQLLAIFYGMEEVVYVADPETYEVLFLNRIAIERWGDRVGDKCYRVLQNRDSPCPFCSNDKIFGENLGESSVWEFKNQVNDRWYRCIDRAIKWPNEKMVRFELAIDITDSKKVEELLRLNEAMFRAAFESAKDCIIVWDKDYNYIYANQSAIDHVGTTRDKVIGKNIRDGLGHVQDFMHLWMARIDDVFRTGNSFHFQDETRMLGKSCFSDSYITPICTNDGSVSHVCVVYRDMTEIKTTEEEARKFRTISDMSLFGNAIADLEGNLTYVNDYFAQIHGYSSDEMIGKKLTLFHNPEQIKIVQRISEGLVKKGKFGPSEVWHTHKNGTEFPMLMSGIVINDSIGNPFCLAASAIDISDQIKAAEAVKKSRALLAKAQEIAQLGSWELDINENVLTCSDVTHLIFGIKDFDFDQSLESFFKRIHPEDRDKVEKEYWDSINNKTSYDIEHRIIRPDGKIRFVHQKCETFRDNNGKPLRSIGMIQDVTELKESEAGLLRQQRAIMLNNRIANIFLTSSQENLYTEILAVILEVFESRFGYWGYIDETGDLICPSITSEIWETCRIAEKFRKFERSNWCGLWGKSLMEKRSIIANEGLKGPAGHFELENALAVPIIHRDKLIGQFVVANRNGGFFQEELDLLESVADQTAPILFALLESERQQIAHKKLEQQFQQAQKLESVGRLAGGVAHDLNNLLTPILGYSEMLLEDERLDNSMSEPIEEILDAGIRARDLVSQLLAFSRKQTLEFKHIDLSQLLRDFKNLLRRTIREDIAINYNLTENLPTIRCDKGQIEQVIMNLAVNSQDAMLDGGVLTIETSLVELDENQIQEQEGAGSEVFVMLSVSDNGSGMDDETQKNIFEPFFTTKRKDKGTGLGLATVYGIVKQHNGNIWLSSDLGIGSSFKIYLPVSTGIDAMVKAVETISKSLKGSECILLVEDNRQVRNLAHTLLKRKGYKVLVSENGKKALELLALYKGPVHLLLTDVIMPEMNGKQLYEKVSEKFPDIKVIYMSGYSESVIAHQGVIDTGVNFIQKPFSVDVLAGKVRETLDIE